MPQQQQAQILGGMLLSCPALTSLLTALHTLTPQLLKLWPQGSLPSLPPKLHFHRSQKEGLQRLHVHKQWACMMLCYICLEPGLQQKRDDKLRYLPTLSGTGNTCHINARCTATMKHIPITRNIESDCRLDNKKAGVATGTTYLQPGALKVLAGWTASMQVRLRLWWYPGACEALSVTAWSRQNGCTTPSLHPPRPARGHQKCVCEHKPLLA